MTDDIAYADNQPGGLQDQAKAALIQGLDKDKFMDLVWRQLDNLEKKAYAPYFQRHCYWTGQPGSRWVYNDLIKTRNLKKLRV